MRGLVRTVATKDAYLLFFPLRYSTPWDISKYFLKKSSAKSSNGKYSAPSR